MRLNAIVNSGTLGVLRLPVFIFIVLSVSAGRVSWERMWLLLGLLGAGMVVSLPLVARRNPTLLAERFRRHSNTEAFDKRFAAVAAPLMAGFLIVAGLDGGRYLWSGLPAWTLEAGVLLHLSGYIPIVWVLCTNPHAEGTVRIQTDRGHRLITAGPYRYVRHPMYTGILLMFSGWPLILGSLWAYLPLAGLAVLLVWRTGREDRTLHADLAGYAEYATRIRYRLLPHVW